LFVHIIGNDIKRLQLIEKNNTFVKIIHMIVIAHYFKLL